MKGWITVESVFHNFLLGQVVAVQVLFSGNGPKAAIENTRNLISCTLKKAKTTIPYWMHIKSLISI